MGQFNVSPTESPEWPGELPPSTKRKKRDKEEKIAQQVLRELSKDVPSETVPRPTYKRGRSEISQVEELGSKILGFEESSSPSMSPEQPLAESTTPVEEFHPTRTPTPVIEPFSDVPPTEPSTPLIEESSLVENMEESATEYPPTDFESVVEFVMKKTIELRGTFRNPPKMGSSTEEREYIDAECAALDRLIEQKRILKNTPDELMTQSQKERKNSALAEFKKMRRELAFYCLYSVFKERTTLVEQGKGIGPDFLDDSVERTISALKKQFGTFADILGITIEQGSLAEIRRNTEQWREVRDCMRRALFRASRQAAPILASMHRKKWKWVSGSKSAALPLIFKYRLPQTPPSLLPSGTLLLHQIAPLSGELSMGICSTTGVNRVALSGVKFSELSGAKKYAEEKVTTFSVERSKEGIQSALKKLQEESPLTLFEESFYVRVLWIRMLQSIQMNGLTDEADRDALKRSLEELREKMSKGQPEGLSDQYQGCIELLGKEISESSTRTDPPKELMRGQVCAGTTQSGKIAYGVILSVADGKATLDFCGDQQEVGVQELIWIDEPAMERQRKSIILPPNERDERGLAISEQLKSNSERIDDCLEALDKKTPLDLTDLERSFIEHPFPILWGSYTEKGVPFRSAISGEEILFGPQALGKNIQVLFVPDEYRMEVREYTRQVQGLIVAPMESLPYLYACGCDFNGFCVHVPTD